MGPFIVHNHYHQNHTHHYPGNSEQFRAILFSLEQLTKGINVMIDKVVQDLMDQAKRNTSFEAAFDLAFKALQAQVTTLQAQISALPVGNVLTDADKALVSASTSDLANSITTLQADVPAGTPAAASAAASTDPAKPALQPDPNAPPAAAQPDPNAPKV